MSIRVCTIIRRIGCNVASRARGGKLYARRKTRFSISHDRAVYYDDDSRFRCTCNYADAYDLRTLFRARASVAVNVSAGKL